MARDGWTITRLGDFVEIRHGYAFKTKLANDEPGPFALFTRKNVAVGGGFRDVSPRYFHGDFDQRFVLDAGDVMLVLTDLSKDGDLLGLPAVVPNSSTVRYLHNQRIGKAVVIADGIDSQFLYALLRSPGYRRHVLETATQTTVRDTAPSRLHAYEFGLPPLPEQRRIGAVLGVLDDKIESNRRLTALLEEAAATLFRARFVDFVGVEAFEESEIGRIPLGWRVAQLSERVEIRMGQSPPGSTYSDAGEGGMLLVQGMGGFGMRYPSSAVTTSAPTKVGPAGCTLMTVRAPVGAVNVARTEVCLGRGVAALISENAGYTEFLARSLRGRWASEESGTIFPAVNGNQIRGLLVPEPPDDQIAAFELVAAPMVAQLAALHNETKSLGEMRDALLPRLISGEIQIPDTADAAEAVGIAAEAA
jgi:type I restriction enzyme S subunit